MILLGPSEVARRLGIHPYTLKRWHENGKLIPVRDSSGKRLYTQEQIEEFMREREAEKQRKEGA